MVYWIVGLDRSAFELFASSANIDVQVTTHQTGSPLFQVDGMANDPMWPCMVQGIDPTLHMLFVDHLRSYEFRRPQGTCSVVPVGIYIADPFADGLVKTPVTLWLPAREGRRAELINRSGLNRPHIRFVDAP